MPPRTEYRKPQIESVEASRLVELLGPAQALASGQRAGGGASGAPIDPLRSPRGTKFGR